MRIVHVLGVSFFVLISTKGLPEPSEFNKHSNEMVNAFYGKALQHTNPEIGEDDETHRT